MAAKEMRSFMKKGFILLTLVLMPALMTSCRYETGAAAAAEAGTAEAAGPAGTTGPEDEERTDYSITRIEGDPVWEEIPALEIDRVLWTEDCGIRAQGQLCYTDEALFVHLRAAEQDIRAENTEPLSPVYEDSCLEFFFQLPDSDNYFNFEINPNGCLCAQYGPEKADRTDLVRSDAEAYFDIQTGRTSDGWEVFYKIPLRFLRLFDPDYRFEGELAANLYKCGNKTVSRHYLAWQPVDLEAPDFHCPEFFGTMRFSGQGSSQKDGQE